MTAELALLDLSLALAYPDEPKTFCTSSRHDNKGYRVASCTREAGHEGGHVDCHQGRKWEDKR